MKYKFFFYVFLDAIGIYIQAAFITRTEVCALRFDLLINVSNVPSINLLNNTLSNLWHGNAKVQR